MNSLYTIISDSILIFWQNLKKTNPGISFTDVGRVLGEKWKKMSGIQCCQFLISCSSTMSNSSFELYYVYWLNCILFYLLNAQRKRRSHTRQKRERIKNVTRMRLVATRIPNPWILIQEMYLTVPKASSILKIILTFYMNAIVCRNLMS